MALTNEPWKVAVGGNRVENMTIEQIAYAFHAGQLNVRTPLWQPGTSGWQALGNFEQFLMQPGANDAHANGYNAEYGGGQYGGNNGLSQFEEADDDPTRMWTGAAEELPGMAPVPAPAMSLPPARPSARTGPRQVPSRAPEPASRPVSASPTARVVTGGVVSSAQARGSKRGNGVWLAAALVGLVGLGTAVLAARGNMSLDALMGKSAPLPAPEPAAAPVEAAPAPVEAAVAAAPAAAPAAAEPAAQLAKFEEASAFVAGAAGEKSAATTPEPTKADSDTESDRPSTSSTKARRLSTRKSSSSKAEKSEKSEKASTEARAKVEAKADTESKTEAKEAKETKAEAEPASESKSANASVNQAAATALANSATLASSCRPSGGPSGSGKARIIYGQDGSVSSVEILTAKFRDTLTGSCVKMVFRRAKIPPFKGEAPTFIKSFTIPDE